MGSLEYQSLGPGNGVLLVTEDEHICVTDGPEEGFKFLGEEGGYTYEFISR